MFILLLLNCNGMDIVQGYVPFWSSTLRGHSVRIMLPDMGTTTTTTTVLAQQHQPTSLPIHRPRQRFGQAFITTTTMMRRMKTPTTATATTRLASTANHANDQDDLGLTPELQKMTTAFQTIGDDKLRYKQLLYMANQLAPLDDQFKIPQYKVIGCLSNVYITATARSNQNGNVDDEPPLIDFAGDSDGLLTKGLVALLVRGLSGCTADQICAVNPQFIQTAGIQSSLTPGRNNGFLNMLQQMKQQAVQVSQDYKQTAIQQSTTNQGENKSTTTRTSTTTTTTQKKEDDDDRPMYRKMKQALATLKPVRLDLKDVSYKHAGHAAMKGVQGGESHFELIVVADAFSGLNLVKRHQLIYVVLGEVMPKIHALQITAAQTPQEAGLAAATPKSK
ncbi:hypothetical protein ACA910_014830 [Epithemia clementina (nom. ined.)]